MARLDYSIGQLLEALRRSGKLANTIVIYMGDHGADLLRGKRTSYEGGVRVPLIIRWPECAEPGHVCQELVSTLDLAPTLLAAGGAPSIPGLPGRDLQPLLKRHEGEGVAWREFMFTEFHLHSAHNFYPQRTVRNQRYKLIENLLPDQVNPGYEFTLKRFFADLPTVIDSAPEPVRSAYLRMKKPPRFELYDLQIDPYEFQNLAGKAEFAEVLDDLSYRLETWRRQTRDPLLDPNTLARLQAEVTACFVDGTPSKSRLKLTYPEYFFSPR